jgi:ABC-2 type transport system ATP-binding protein
MSARTGEPTEATSEPAIVLENLRRSFVRKSGKGLRRTSQEVVAVDGISLTVPRGEIVGWLGPNGAGKSTTIKMCTGILVPTNGSVRVGGLDPVAQRRTLARTIGVVFGQRSQLWWDLPVEESFTLLHRIHRTEETRHRELVDLFAMKDQLTTPVRQLSLGQRMRAELVAALLHEPSVLFLDEPTIGLDVVSKHALREALLALRRDRGVTIVLTTHDLGDVRRLCDRVVVVDHGRVALDTNLEGLLARAGTHRTLVATFTSIEDAETVRTHRNIEGVAVVAVDGPRVTFDVDLTQVTIPQALEAIGAVVPIADLSVEERDIEAIVRDLYRG